MVELRGGGGEREKNVQNTMNEILEDVKNSYNNSERLQSMNCGCICVLVPCFST